MDGAHCRGDVGDRCKLRVQVILDQVKPSWLPFAGEVMLDSTLLGFVAPALCWLVLVRPVVLRQEQFRRFSQRVSNTVEGLQCSEFREAALGALVSESGGVGGYIAVVGEGDDLSSVISIVGKAPVQIEPFVPEGTMWEQFAQRSVVIQGFKACATYPGDPVLSRTRAECAAGFALRDSEGHAFGMMVIAHRMRGHEVDALLTVGRLLATQVAESILRSNAEALASQAQLRGERLQRRNSQLLLLIDNASLVSVTDAKGVINYANKKFCEVSGYTLPELLGQDHRIINSGEHPKEMWTGLYRDIHEGKTWSGEVKNRSKDGKAYWVKATARGMFDEHGTLEQIMSVRFEITDLKLAEQKSRVLVAAVESSSDAVCVVNNQGGVFYGNSAFWKTLGVPSENTDGFILLESVASGDDAARLREALCTKNKSSMRVRMLRGGVQGRWAMTPRSLSQKRQRLLSRSGRPIGRMFK